MHTILYANLQSSGPSMGGVETYLAALIKSLGQLSDGDDSYVVIGPPSGADWLEKVVGPNQELRRLPPGTSDGAGRRALRKAASLARRVDRLASRWPLFRSGVSPEIQRQKQSYDHPHLSNGFIESLRGDAIHFPYQHFIVTSLPSIFNPHDLQHLHLPQFFSPETIHRRESLYPVACKLATRVAVASDWIADDVCAQYGISRRKVSVVPWGAASAAHPEPTEEDLQRIRNVYGLTAPYLFYPAVAWPHKNHARLLEAMHILVQRDRPLLLALTGGETELTPLLKERARTLGVAERVRFLGKVPAADMRPLFRGAQAVAVPTLFEAVSGPVAEAWQESTPVACSDIPQLREQAHGAAVFFNPHSASSIADSLEQLLEDSDVRREIISLGRKRISSLTWDSTARKYRQLYREIAFSSPLLR
jgi:glycosyltransferase involved in cell wall biosynthesis